MTLAKRLSWTLVVVVLLLQVAGCQPEAPQPTPVPPTATTAPTDTPQPTATDTATPTPTSTATDTPVPTPKLVKGTCVEVVDGDTIKVEMHGTVYAIRYIGIDCPEMDQQFGGEAADANRELVEGKTVLLERDVSDVDRYDRLLRYVYLTNGLMVNAELVRQSYAIAKKYPPDEKYVGEFYQLQREAKSAGLVIWSLTPVPTVAPTTIPTPIVTAVPPTAPPEPTQPPTAVPTAVPPTAPPSVGAIVQIIAVDKRAEYVDICNSGDQPQDLSGWVLLSERGGQACGLGGVIDAGQTLRIWAMTKDADKGGYNCGFGTNIWNNSKSDPAVLFNAAGQEVSRR